MSAFRALFHTKISLSVLPKEYYNPMKSFYKSLSIQKTFDMGPLMEIVALSKIKGDFDTHIYYIIQGFTIMLRKMQQTQEEAKKSEESGKKVESIPLYSYAYLLAGLHFCISNHQVPIVTSKWEHEAEDNYARADWKYCLNENKEVTKINITNSYLKNLLPSRKKNSEFIDVYKNKLEKLIKEFFGGVSKKKYSKKMEEYKLDETRSSSIPHSMKVYINTFLIFLHDLCYLTPMITDDK